ncbi:MAG: hypothetical protein KC454_09835 [Flavobacteriales bacterium]|nr:hypothetical protein [Flavobacteriales bacterium]
MIVKDQFPTAFPKEDDLNDIKMPTKLLVAFLAAFKIPSFKSIQCVFDFEESEINADVINKNAEEYDNKVEVEDEDKDKDEDEDKNLKIKFLESIRKIEKTAPLAGAEEEGDVENFSIGSKYTNIVKNSPYETVPISITKPNPKVVFSNFLTNGARDFEEYYKAEYKNNNVVFLKKKIHDEEIPSIPLFFISAAQSRKKNKKFGTYYEDWKTFAEPANVNDIKDDGQAGAVIKSPPDETTAFTTQKDWDKWTSRDPKKNIIPNRVKFLMNGDNFSFTSFHANIVFYFEGLTFSLGYGLDQDTDTYKNSILYKLEQSIKKTAAGKAAFENTELFGEGVLFSPDSIDTENDTYNFKILDIGILNTNMIHSINAIFSTIKVVKSMMYVKKIPKVVEDGVEVKSARMNLEYESFYAPLTTTYSRLATNTLPKIFGLTYFNCSSFVEKISGGRLYCGVVSNPNNCESNTIKTNLKTKEAQTKFLISFLNQTINVEELKNTLDYNPFSFMERVSMGLSY